MKNISEERITKQNGINSEVDYISRIRKLVSEIRYGTVTIVVQDGKVVQLERNEKYRI